MGARPIRSRFAFDNRKFVRIATVPALLLLFSLLCGLFVTLLGPQHDEVLFAGILLPPYEYTHSLDWGGFEFLLMLDYYLGALKGWLYAPLIAWFPTNLWTLRIPVILMGAATIWLLFRMLEPRVGYLPAACVCLLLAVDPIYILTTTFDWGPCVLQRLLLVGSIAAAVAYRERPRWWMAALAGLCAGLAVWDKLSAAWMLFGCGAAALLVYGREVWRSLKPGPVAAFVASLLAGASPAIYANWGEWGKAAARNAALADSTLAVKAHRLWISLDGSALFAYLTRATDVDSHAGAWLLVLVAVAIPLWRREIVWALLALALSVCAMFATVGGAGGGHHVALLWPLPQMAVGLALGRWMGSAQKMVSIAAAAMLIVAVASSLRVDYGYYQRIVDYGSAVRWTDGSEGLEQALTTRRPVRVYAMDWGIVGPMRYLSGGRLPLSYGGDLSPQVLRPMLASPDYLFVAHPEGSELIVGTRQRLHDFAKTAGYTEQTLARVRDARGTTVFEIYRFRRR